MKIKELRTQKKISQTELGTAIGVERSTICQYEKGTRTPNSNTLIKLADFFGVTIDYLLEHKTTKKEPKIHKKNCSKNIMFAKQLKTLRKEKHLTQTELADELHFTHGAIAMWETNKRQPDNETLLQLADYFNVTVDYLLGRKNIKNIEMKNLRDLRKSKNISMKSLGKTIGVAESTIHHWETGRSQPDNETLLRLADFFGVTVDYLLGRENKKNPPNVYDVDGIVSFPEIGTICAGFNGTLNETFTGEIVDIPLSMISGGHKEDYFVLRVKGNSMYPKLIDGDKILCKKTESVDNGDLAVILYDDECATVKRIHYVQGENWIELIPINPEFLPKRIEGNELEQCRILGKVVKLIRDL